MAPGRT
ncbi:hypothetical protein ECFDA507_2011, partial [Escherichia coli FDA507]